MVISDLGQIREYLVWDYERILGLLDHVGDGPITGPTHVMLRQALVRHIAIEERILLPAVRRARWGEPLALEGEVREEHAALAGMLNGCSDPARRGELRAALIRHGARERGIGGLFPECERYLAPHESACAAVKAATFGWADIGHPGPK